ncbi:MAG: sulfide/dihydroorotate dehydrogenase-like FAD/NAD-binding protein [Candidatus Omnitrophota bacterium]|nr:sulfide/dihydroorotate dehydrogenase-like FAD/NAD-binding protein [Candidatus Omnitrophota bacterium]
MKIIRKDILVQARDARIVSLEVLAPEIAKKALSGQFVVLMATEAGERIPLTIVESDVGRGAIRVIFQEVGLTTRLLGKLEPGESLFALAGPLGHPTEIKKYGRVILVGGGVGIAEIYPVAKGFKAAGNQVTVILGARTKELLILEAELKKLSDAFYVATDDGSSGRKGFTTDILKELLTHDPRPTTHDLVYAVGPIPMMQRVAAVAKDSGVKVIVSLNALMVDGTGMCGCCRVNVGGETKFSCVDGPEFDGQLVDWEGLIKRNKAYAEQEKHICKIAR